MQWHCLTTAEGEQASAGPVITSVYGSPRTRLHSCVVHNTVHAVACLGSQMPPGKQTRHWCPECAVFIIRPPTMSSFTSFLLHPTYTLIFAHPLTHSPSLAHPFLTPLPHTCSDSEPPNKDKKEISAILCTWTFCSKFYVLLTKED